MALQVYVAAPLALKVVLCPVQMAAGVALTVSEGSGVTLTETVVVSLQEPVVPISV